MIAGKQDYQQYDDTTHGTPGQAKAMINASVLVREAVFVNNGAENISIGPTGAASFYACIPGETFNIGQAAGPQFDLANWRTKCATGASQNYSVIYR